jgi:hypothetical protein
MKYKAELYIITHELTDQNGKVIREVERIDIPVNSFEVDGGANRKINLASVDEVSVSSEFEQARSLKNIIFYIPPTKDFLALKLVDMTRHGIVEMFDITFVISIYSNGQLIKALRISSEWAWFVKTPAPEGKTPPLLKAWVHFNTAQLLYGQLDPKLKKLVHKEM